MTAPDLRALAGIMDRARRNRVVRQSLARGGWMNGPRTDRLPESWLTPTGAQL
jgi:hypothetical protein